MEVAINKYLPFERWSKEKFPFLSVRPIFTSEESLAFNKETVAASIIFWSPPSVTFPVIVPDKVWARRNFEAIKKIRVRSADFVMADLLLCFKYYRTKLSTLFSIVHNYTWKVKMFCERLLFWGETKSGPESYRGDKRWLLLPNVTTAVALINIYSEYCKAVGFLLEVKIIMPVNPNITNAAEINSACVG